MTTDTEGARAFYTHAIGWGIEMWEGGKQPYPMWKAGEKAIGGVMPLPEDARKGGVPPHWIAYVSVPDLDATTAKAKELGATVLVPATEIPDGGRFSILQDPQGAAFAVHSSSGEDAGPSGPPGMGQVGWHELAVEDYEAAYDFYSALFGWEKTQAMDMGEGAMYQMYRAPGMEYDLGGMFTKSAEMPSSWLYYIKVDAVDSALARIREAGGQVVNGPMEVPGGDHVAQCTDPQGAFFAIMGPGTA
jgi:predicted enzyme related to lactoylglutathione lyase